MPGEVPEAAGVRGQVILVTGSSRGIGREIAATLAGAGATVVVTGRDHARAWKVAHSLPGDALAVAADLSRPEAAEGLVAESVDKAGRLDGLVNNAGIPLVQPSAETSLADWNRVLDLNLTASFFCAQAAAAAFAGEGVILNIASIAAITGLPGRAAYAASKSALVALTKVLAVEWAPNIRVNAIAPGYIRTDLMDTLIKDGKVRSEAIERRAPAGRFGTPDDVARAALFLLGRESGYVTGETLAVDGGWLVNGGARA